ncbi:hypothetical protein DL96DRAFT_1600027 [Flagelloscypha sp. PMI_526]|nr:hypothetical protein DL96DRAFT_1600027 [Flagelloscypha sp. PMI_526]
MVILKTYLPTAPAEDHLEYQVKVFPNVMDITPYRGVSDDVDKAWKDLYKGTFMRLPKDEAAKLPNRTWPIADEPGYYIAQFDVFHQLHCLNYLRQSLDREHYLKTHDAEGLADHHLRHCVDSIRESLMCSSDIASIVWQWDEEVHGVRGRTAVAHSCRNFDKLLEWTQARGLDKMINLKEKLDVGLPDFPIIT